MFTFMQQAFFVLNDMQSIIEGNNNEGVHSAIKKGVCARFN